MLASNTPVYQAPLRERLRCLLHGGHQLYRNAEFGGLWCFRCGGGWKPVVPDIAHTDRINYGDPEA